MPNDVLLLCVIIVAGFYMAWNIGANDVANAMGTSVGSGALRLGQAVILAAILEFAGAFFFGSHVSETIQKGLIDPHVFMEQPQILVYGMLASLLAAGVWLQLASYLGLPVSTTHTIVGSVVGFGVIVGGWDAIKWENVGFILASWVISPLAGGILAYSLFTILRQKIFYASHPLLEAKKIAPILVFLVVVTLSLALVFEGLNNVHLKLSTWEALGWSLGMGILGALVSYVCLWFMPIQPTIAIEKAPAYSVEISYALDKAKKHLQRVQSASKGEMHYHVSILLQEIDSMSNSLKQTLGKEVIHSEYTAIEKIFGYLQIMSAALMAFAHGANDVANAIGPLAGAIGILTTGVVAMQLAIPTWTLALGGIGIVVGLATWGWRVIETIGKKITELTPTRGFAAEFGAAATILLASRLGMPISTTHTLVGAVIGVGLARGIEALNIGMTRDIIISWFVTVPVGAFLAVAFFYGIRLVFG
jgi:PiT family inorganic phosphate transporter